MPNAANSVWDLNSGAQRLAGLLSAVINLSIGRGSFGSIQHSQFEYVGRISNGTSFGKRKAQIRLSPSLMTSLIVIR
jgi:hypothetical protein